MLIIWGTTSRQERLGWVADWCTFCERPSAFRVTDYYQVGHIYYIPLGRGHIVATTRRCRNCQKEFRCHERDYDEFVEHEDALHMPMAELIRRTNSRLVKYLAARVQSSLSAEQNQTDQPGIEDRTEPSRRPSPPQDDRYDRDDRLRRRRPRRDDRDDDRNFEPRRRKSGMSGWLIGLLVGLGLLALVGIVAFFVKVEDNVQQANKRKAAEQQRAAEQLKGVPISADPNPAYPEVELTFVPATKIADIKTTVVASGAGWSPPCLCWADDATAFYHVDGAGTVRRFSYPEMKEQASNPIGRRCDWISVSSEGVVATVKGTREAWLLDGQTLRELKKIPIGDAGNVASSAGTAYAYAVDRSAPNQSLTVLDLKTGLAVRRYPRQNNGAGFDHLVVAPDGKLVFTSGLNQLFRIKARGSELTDFAKSEAYMQGDCAGVCIDAAGGYICAPLGGGNAGNANFSTPVFAAANFSKPVLTIASGPRSLTTVGFDVGSGLIYAAGSAGPLMIFDTHGGKIRDFHLATAKNPRAVPRTIQILAHPSGRHFLALAENNPAADEGWKIYSVQLLAANATVPPKLNPPKINPLKPFPPFPKKLGQ